MRDSLAYHCDDCGLDLSLTEGQIEHLRKYGNPVTRPSCPKNANGRHRVSAEQLSVALRTIRADFTRAYFGGDK